MRLTLQVAEGSEQEIEACSLFAVFEGPTSLTGFS
jgi:hypothetical protein